jgi:ribosomal protein S18 acetylase RimI-like enzyme
MKYKFVNKVKGEVVASLYFYTVRLPSRKLGVIEEVWTDEAYRRQGRATSLIKRAIAKGKALKLDCIELTVRQDRPEIQKFYQSLGFKDRLNLAYRLKL